MLNPEFRRLIEFGKIKFFKKKYTVKLNKIVEEF